jgi:hypothetical protein
MAARSRATLTLDRAMVRFKTENRAYDDDNNPLSYFSDDSSNGSGNMIGSFSNSTSNHQLSGSTSQPSFNAETSTAMVGSVSNSISDNPLSNSAIRPSINAEAPTTVAGGSSELSGSFFNGFPNPSTNTSSQNPNTLSTSYTDHNQQGIYQADGRGAILTPMDFSNYNLHQDTVGIGAQFQGGNISYAEMLDVKDLGLESTLYNPSPVTPSRGELADAELHLANDTALARRSPQAFTGHYTSHVFPYTQTGAFTSGNMSHAEIDPSMFAPQNGRTMYDMAVDNGFATGVYGNTMSRAEYDAHMSASTFRASEQTALDELAFQHCGAPSRQVYGTPTKTRHPHFGQTFAGSEDDADMFSFGATDIPGYLSHDHQSFFSFNDTDDIEDHQSRRPGTAPARPTTSRKTVETDNADETYADSEEEHSEDVDQPARKRKRGEKNSGTTKKAVNKDGRDRKFRAPRAPLCRWGLDDLAAALIGIVWACGEAGLKIPFEQAAQLVHVDCTAGALQQALLKLHAQMEAEGKQYPKMKMHWTKKGAVPSVVRDPSKVPRRKPTMRRAEQSFLITLKRAYVEADRAALAYPHTFDTGESVPVDNVYGESSRSVIWPPQLPGLRGERFPAGGRGGYNGLADGLSGTVGTSSNAFADPRETSIAFGGRDGYNTPIDVLHDTIYTSTNALVDPTYANASRANNFFGTILNTPLNTSSTAPTNRSGFTTPPPFVPATPARPTRGESGMTYRLGFPSDSPLLDYGEPGDIELKSRDDDVEFLNMSFGGNNDK